MDDVGGAGAGGASGARGNGAVGAAAAAERAAAAAKKAANALLAETAAAETAAKETAKETATIAAATDPTKETATNAAATDPTRRELDFASPARRDSSRDSSRFGGDSSLLGASVAGVVTGGFDAGYFFTCEVNGRRARGMLFSPVLAAQSATTDGAATIVLPSYCYPGALRYEGAIQSVLFRGDAGEVTRAPGRRRRRRRRRTPGHARGKKRARDGTEKTGKAEKAADLAPRVAGADLAPRVVVASAPTGLSDPPPKRKGWPRGNLAGRGASGRA